jgi:hypothetical protein
MSRKQWKLLDVMQRIENGQLTNREAALVLGLSERYRVLWISGEPVVERYLVAAECPLNVCDLLDRPCVQRNFQRREALANFVPIKNFTPSLAAALCVNVTETDEPQNFSVDLRGRRTETNEDAGRYEKAEYRVRSGNLRKIC